MSPTNVITTHPELWGALDNPSEDDRAWFHRHPGEVVRIRPQFPDEIEAREAVAQVIGAGGFVSLDVFLEDGQRLPTDWVVVVDLLRMDGKPHGPDGESGRTRYACPAPMTPEIRELITTAAVDYTAACFEQLRRQARRQRAGGRGFAAPHPHHRPR